MLLSVEGSLGDPGSNPSPRPLINATIRTCIPNRAVLEQGKSGRSDIRFR